MPWRYTSIAVKSYKLFRHFFEVKVHKGRHYFTQSSNDIIALKSPRSYEHKMHAFRKYVSYTPTEITTPIHPHRCNVCQSYLHGQISIGIECLECNSFFHDHCFMEDTLNTVMGRPFFKISYILS